MTSATLTPATERTALAAEKSSRIPELDGIRGFAILIVLMWHYIACEILAPEATRFASQVKQVLSLTWSGVDLFFVLSGFLITGILLDHRNADNYFRVFYVRRICRIFPLYYLMLGSYVLLSAFGAKEWPNFGWLFHDPLPLWTYATFTQNIVMGLWASWGPHWLAMTWSLAVEEQFYFVIPFLVWFLPRRAFVAAAVVLIFLAPFLQALWGGMQGHVWTPWRGDSMLTGSLLALMVRNPKLLEMFRANVAGLYAALLGFFVGAVVLTRDPSTFGAAKFSWLAGLYATLILLAYVDRTTWVARIARRPSLQWMGTVSYGIYMYHQAVSGLMHGWLGGGTPSIDSSNGRVITALSLSITFVMAELSYRFLERPFLEWGRNVRYASNPN